MATKARKTADDMESDRMSPMLKKAGATSPLTVPALALDAVRNKALGKKARSEEELNEIARESRRGEKSEYAKGGRVTRGDGIAKRGKTRGRYV